MDIDIHNIVIVGGTHGNERIGFHLVKKFQQSPELLFRPHLSTVCIIGNPQACMQNQRYLEADLNRCFLKADLENTQLIAYEEQIAKALYQTFGPKGNTARFLLDLHSTTANMGLTLILVNDHPFNLQLAAYLTHHNPLIKVYRWTQTDEENAFVSSICELGFAIEVGPTPQGILVASLFAQTEQLIHQILDYLTLMNQGSPPKIPKQLTLFQHLETLDYPKSAQGELAGMIHPQRQGQDFQPLDPGDPLFLTFQGQTIAYEGNSRVWPIFINEAAYYEKGIAMCLTQKLDIAIQAS
ncbi:aspartoacylase [Acaryochloris sp. IP29b_bin.137]|uniref:aspartoacylase n=1 Tax=Acaryochloris sp. IP29b_bin.137 TaxID=2969217 RepID=UPI0026262B2F|nr:aspartoacylase [Acaryochloris sp. IP29b_bin.137]